MQSPNPSPFFKNALWINLCLSAIIIGLLTLLALHTTMPSYYSAAGFVGYGDGYTYSAIANNLAHGIGQPWSPQYGLCRFHEFYEHPALGLIIQSYFFKVFGTHWYTARIFCLCTYVLTMISLCFLWKKHHVKVSVWLCWLPVLFWLFFPLNLYFYTSNSLESVTTLLSLLAVIFLVYSNQLDQLFKLKQLIYLLLAAISLVAALLINGPLSLFVLSVDLLLYIAYKKHSFGFHFTRTLILLMLCVMLFFLLFHFIPKAEYNYIMYLKKQLIATLAGRRQDNWHFGWHHFYIIKIWLKNAIPIVFICALITLAIKPTISWKNNKTAIFYTLLAAASLLPIAISSKQFAHYTLHTNIYFLLVILALMTQPIETACSQIRLNSTRFRIMLAGSWLIVFICLGVFILFLIKPISPDSISLLAKKIHDQIGNQKKLSIRTPQLNKNPALLESIMQRNYGISWCPQSNEKYLLQLDKKVDKIAGYHLIKSDYHVPVWLYQQDEHRDSH